MSKFNFIKTDIPDVQIIEPTVFGDDRGYFMETYQIDEFAAAGIDKPFVQDNQSRSTKGVLRGLHFQTKHTQGKLVRVTLGEVFDVAVDCRPNSKTFGKWVGATLSADNKKMLKADIILVSDTSMISMQIPSITCGLRGLTYMEVEVTGPNKDLHSGLFGGAVANPANVLARMVASLIDENGHVTIPGFYDDVRELTAAERKAFNKAPFNLTEYKKALEIGDVEGEAGFTTIERTGIRPSLDVNGIWGGYIEEGTKTVIPSKASAKISMRLVPNQDYRKISRLFEKYFRSIAPKSVKVKVKSLHGGMPYVAPTDMPAYKAAQKAIAETFGKKPLPFYSGGSIPIISGFESILGIKSLLIGFGLAEDAIHSPNESFGLDQFQRGIETIPYFYRYFAEM